MLAEIGVRMLVAAGREPIDLECLLAESGNCLTVDTARNSLHYQAERAGSEIILEQLRIVQDQRAMRFCGSVSK